MRNITIVLIVLLFFAGMQPSFAAIPVAPATTTSGTNAQSTTTAHRSEKTTWFNTKVDQLKSIFHPEHRVPDLGKIALIFGICGFIPVIGWMPAIAAIIMGAIGMHKKKDDKKAKVGMILGIVSLALGIIIFAAILISLSA